MNRDICKRTELLQKIKEFRLFDDDFMSRVFDNNIECTELILRIILNNQDIKVKKVCTQSEIKNLYGRSVRLDIYATDEDNKPLAEQVRYYKEDLKGAEDMCRIVEDIVEKEKREEKIEMIARMKRVGKLSFDEISEITGFTVEEIEAIKAADGEQDLTTDN